MILFKKAIPKAGDYVLSTHFAWFPVYIYDEDEKGRSRSFYVWLDTYYEKKVEGQFGISYVYRSLTPYDKKTKLKVVE